MSGTQLSGHSALTRQIRIAGYVETITALHVGAARDLSITGSELPVIKHNDGRPFIPASSFKGVLRSNIEALIRGLNKAENTTLSNQRADGNGFCDVVAEKYCVPEGEWDDIQSVLDKSCDVCRLFGGPQIAPKLYIRDMPVRKATWASPMLQIRDAVAIDRDRRTTAGAKKFDFETVMPGVRFDLALTIENPEDHEIGLLLNGLGLFERGIAALGGQTSRGLGRVKVVVEEIRDLDPKVFFTDQTEEPRALSQLCEQYQAALRQKLTGQ